MIRRSLAVGLAGALGAAGLAACGGDSEETTGPISLRMTVWSANDDHLALFNAIADEYMADNPDVTEIAFDPLPFETYTTALTTQIAGGNPPDLAWIFESNAPDFVTSGALVPLDDALGDADGYEYDDLVPATTDLWRDEGTLYAYPFSTSPFGVFANLDLLDEAGQGAPAEMIAAGEWDWDTVIDASEAVGEQTGAAGMVIRDFDYTGWDYLSTQWTGWGAQAWSDDGSTCGFAQPEMVESMTFLHDAIFTRQAMPGPGTSADFFAGEAAYTVTQISRASLLDEDGFDWDLVPLPAGPAGEYAVIGQAGLGVLTQSENPQAATDFLAFMTNPENSAKLAQYFPPPRQSQLTADTLAQTNPLLSAEQLQDVVIDGISTGVVKPSNTSQAELNQIIRAELDDLWLPNADIPAVLDSVCEAIDPLLAG
ncbi:sugar ABC transporter substrate-binding protein [Natronosporangium hydrolyticum]|uniref:Sugar ABC transporter substrate-binding protein n=2 Tax=Natronosporangium hydrolyticum TaxID=2811111 RepID=A0A895YSZ7_9ACTN|nr:sugar ABC transporter substrate-binding protein [Natronosporangium hydrolyticum]